MDEEPEGAAARFTEKTPAKLERADGTWYYTCATHNWDAVVNNTTDRLDFDRVRLAEVLDGGWGA